MPPEHCRGQIREQAPKGIMGGQVCQLVRQHRFLLRLLEPGRKVQRQTNSRVNQSKGNRTGQPGGFNDAYLAFDPNGLRQLVRSLQEHGVNDRVAAQAEKDEETTREANPRSDETRSDSPYQAQP